MFSDRALALLGGIANTETPTAVQRAVALGLRPAVLDASRELALAAEALTGPDPEAGVLYLLDALRDLGVAFDRATARPPR